MQVWLPILSEALFHSVWQFAVLGALLWGFLKLVPNKHAQLRAWFALLTIYLAPFVFIATCAVIAARESTGIAVSSPAPGPQLDLHQIVVAMWGAGLLWQSSNLVMSVLGVGRLARHALMPASDELQGIFARLCAKAGHTAPITIGFSKHVQGACTAGYWKPIIYLPISISTHLSTSEIEAILAHELAHILRGDFLHHCLQSAIAACFFYHPAIRLASRAWSKEREHACDDLAVSLLGQGGDLATGLLRAGLAEERSQLILNSISSQTLDLKERIGRLTNVPSGDPRREMMRRKAVVMNSLGAGLLLGACAFFLPYLAYAEVPQLNRQQMLAIKDNVCDRLTDDAIYDDARYYSGGPANISVSGNRLVMNGKPLPKDTEAVIWQAFREQGLKKSEVVRLRFHGEEVMLAIKPFKESEHAATHIYRHDWRSGIVTHYSVFEQSDA